MLWKRFARAALVAALLALLGSASMHRTNEAGALAGGHYTEEDPLTGQEATKVGAGEMEAIQEEISHVIEQNGIALDEDDNTQLYQAISKMLGPSGWPSKNLLINGAFDLWQRAQTLASVTGGTAAFAADRWRLHPGNAANQVAYGRQAFAFDQTDVPGSPTYWCRITNVNAQVSVSKYLEQRIEHVQTGAGKLLTLSFWAKRVGGSATPIDVRIVQNFGTGGSPSTETNTLVASFSDLTTDWVLYTASFTPASVAGKTLGSNQNDYVSLRLELSGVSISSSYDIVLVQLEPGAAATGFQFLPRPMVEQLCMRFFEKSGPVDTVVAGGDYEGSARGYQDGGTKAYALDRRFRVDKRAVPTMVWRNPSSGSPNTLEWNAINKTVSSTEDGGRSSTGTPVVSVDMGGGGPWKVSAHWEADAEL